VQIRDVLLHANFIGDLASGGHRFVLGSPDNSIHLRNLPEAHDAARVQAGHDNLAALQISLDGSTLISLGYYGDWPIRVWRLPQMEKIAERKDVRDVHRICLSEDGKFLALFTGRGTMTVVTVPSLAGPPLWQATDAVAGWTACVFSPDSRLLATACSSGHLFVWDLTTRRRLDLPPTLTSYNSVSFSSDGTRLIATDEKTATLFDAATGERLLAFNFSGLQTAFVRNSDGLLAVNTNRSMIFHAPSLEKLRFDWLRDGSKTHQ
jgi:WD40 repeat protein